MNNLNHFQVGGTLGSDNNSYVVRQADRELLNCLLKGNFCFVLNCRQMGKSSLMVKTADKLRGKNVSCAFSDLSVLGVADVSSEQWYKSFAYQLLESLDLDEIDLDGWWEKHNSLTAINCLEFFLEKVILTQLSNNIVIFVDEIDSIIRLPFKDDFFALIRGFYNQRTIKKEYKRLTFCLLGVATPPDLIKDKVRTPFNIGYPIELSGFTIEEAKDALIPGFPSSIAQPEAILKEVIEWTGGQPFLTQKLCLLVARHSNSTTPNIKEIVRQYIVINWESQDYPQHFKTISDRILDNSHYTLKLLELYRQILQQKKIIADDSLAQNKLRISGLVNKENNYLTVYNPIYKQIFSLSWIREQLDIIRPYSSQINRWLASNFSDEELLNEKSLIEALKWAENRNITREEHQYLSASREYRSRQEVLIAKQEKNKIITQSKIFLSATIVIAGAIITSAILFANDKRNRAEISILDRDSTIALQEFDRGEQIKSLSRAIAINSQLTNKINPRQNITNYSTVKPIEAINNIINQIQEKNAIELFDRAITSIVYSADGQLISGDREGIIKVWNTNNNRVTDWNYSQNKGKITSIAVNSDGEVYVTNGQKGVGITVYDSHGKIKTFLKNNDEIYGLALSPNDNFLVSGNNLGELTLWSKDGQKITNWLAHEGTINSIAISPDGQTIATASNDTTAKLWTKEGKLITTLSGKNIGHSDSVNSVAFSPDGKTIATVSNDTTIKLWNLKGSLINTLSEHSDSVNSVAFSPNGNIIVSASSDTTIRLWNKRGIQQTIRGHQEGVNSIVFNPDNNTFASADDKGIIKVWEIDSFQSRINTGTFLRDRQQVLLNSPQGNTIQSIEGKIIKQFPNPQNKFINSIAISPDNKNVIVGTEDGIIAKLNLHSDTWQLFDKERYPGKIITVDIHPSGEKLITLGIDESQKVPQYIIKQWSIEGNLINTFNNHEQQEMTAIEYSPQGDKIAIATTKGIELWDNEGNYIDRIVEREATNNTSENITSISFSPDNQLIATASKNGIIQLRKIGGTLLATFTKNNNRPIVHLDFTADNKTIEAIDQYGMVSSWHLDVDTLIQEGCNWLQDYLATQNDNSEITQTCTL